jgi:hypothetical protein
MTDTSAQLMFHSRIVPLDAELHGELKLNRDAGFGFSAGVATAPIGIDEFEVAAHSYPILFTDGSPPIPIVLLGFRPGWNLFVNDLGGWMQGAYVPAIVRAFPFAIIESENSATRQLGFESDAACITPSTGLPLFDGGNPTTVVRDALAFCQACQASMNESINFGAALERARVLEPQSVTIETTGGAKASIDGFRTVDRNKLAAVLDDVILSWRSRNWLLPLYAHLLSAANWLPFTELATAQLSARQ